MTNVKTKKVNEKPKQDKKETNEQKIVNELLAIDEKLNNIKNKDMKNKLIQIPSELYDFVDEFSTYLNLISKYSKGKGISVNRLFALSLIKALGIEVTTKGEINRGFIQKNVKAIVEEMALAKINYKKAKGGDKNE